jgi:nucleotide-binding universal stress UspA family protein
MRKILVATDGSAHSERAVAHAAWLSKAGGVPLVVAMVNVMLGARGPLTLSHPEAEAKAIVDKAAAEARTAGATVEAATVVTGREASSAVVNFAEANGVDVIVTGTGDKSGLSRLVLGSVAGDIAARAHCTVVIAR